MSVDQGIPPRLPMGAAAADGHRNHLVPVRRCGAPVAAIACPGPRPGPSAAGKVRQGCQMGLEDLCEAAGLDAPGNAVGRFKHDLHRRDACPMSCDESLRPPGARQVSILQTERPGISHRASAPVLSRRPASKLSSRGERSHRVAGERPGRLRGPSGVRCQCRHRPPVGACVELKATSIPGVTGQRATPVSARALDFSLTDFIRAVARQPDTPEPHGARAQQTGALAKASERSSHAESIDWGHQGGQRFHAVSSGGPRAPRTERQALGLPRFPR